MYIAISLEETTGLTIVVGEKSGSFGTLELTDSGQLSYYNNGISLSEFSKALKSSLANGELVNKLSPSAKDEVFTALESLADILDAATWKPN
jgi:hypothetical protein